MARLLKALCALALATTACGSATGSSGLHFSSRRTVRADGLSKKPLKIRIKDAATTSGSSVPSLSQDALKKVRQKYARRHASSSQSNKQAMRPRRYHKIDDSQLPSFMQKYDSNRDSELIEHVIRTRERVKMRPHDVVIISYPRSGTNWLASVLTDLIPAATEAVDRLKEELSDSSILDPYLFHGYPVFWLLPDAKTAQVPDEVYAALERIPPSMPRIFLSHQPYMHFEYNPDRRTSVMYLLREPHEVWHSTLNMMERFRDSQASLLGQYAVGGTRTIDTDQFTEDFVLGSMPLPPRLAEYGPAFAWNSHVAGWTGSEKGSMQAVASARKALLASWRYSTVPRRSSMNIGIVDFNLAMENPVASIDAIKSFLPSNSAHTAARNATEVAYRASFPVVASHIMESMDPLKAAVELGPHAQALNMIGTTVSHFDEDAANEPTWAARFDELSTRMRKSFEITSLAAYAPVRNRGCGGDGCVIPVLNVV